MKSGIPKPGEIRVAQCLAGAEVGGAENFYTRLVCALTAAPNISQRAFTRNNEYRVKALAAAGVPVETFRFGSRLNLLDNFLYRKSLRDYAPDIVLTYMNRASGLTPPGNYRLIARLGHFYKLKYYRHSDYWIGNTKGICDYLVAGGMPADRVFHIPNFADETPVSPASRADFETPEHVPLLVAAGRLHINKGFDTLLQAMADIPEAILWLAGSGPEESNLKSQAKALAIDDRVRFLGWRRDVPALMQAGDIFVCPSRHEGLGSIVLESWLHGCPVVATNSQGPGEIINDGNTGIITPIDQVAPLAAAINDLIQSPQQRERLAQKGHRHYMENYSQRVIVERYASLFEDVMAKPKPQADLQ